MADNNHISIDHGTGNITLQDVSGENININSLEAIEEAFKNVHKDYLLELKEQLGAQKGLLEKINLKFVENTEKAINDRLQIINNSKNVVGGSVDKIDHLGDNIYSSPIDELRGRIISTINFPNLPENLKKQLQELAKQAIVQNISKYQKILVEFAKTEAEIESLTNDTIRKYAIWLNRNKQKNKYNEDIRKHTTVPFIFAIAGKYEDKTDFASETLQEHHINNVFRIKDPDNVLKNRINQAISITNEKSVNTIYDTLIREILDIGINGATTEELPDLLNKKHGDRNIFIICPVSDWSDAGITEFFKLFQQIKRKPQTPFVLLLEFENQDFEKLSYIFNKFSDNKYNIALLPEIEKVSDNEISEFNRNYNNIFIDGTLNPKDAPIFYSEAIKKLKLR